MQVSERPVSDWLNSIEDSRAEDIRVLDALIGDIFSDDSRVLLVGKFWGGTDQTIIGYGDLEQPRPKDEVMKWFVVRLALQKANISIYVNAIKDGQHIGKSYGKQLGKIKLRSASIGFKSLADLDIDVFTAMLRQTRELAG